MHVPGRQSHDGNDIEAQLLMYVKHLYISIGRNAEIPHLLLINGIGGQGDLARTACLHLDKNTGNAIGRQGDDVDLELAVPPATLADGISLIVQVSDGCILTPFSKIIVRCHVLMFRDDVLQKYGFYSTHQKECRKFATMKTDTAMTDDEQRKQDEQFMQKALAEAHAAYDEGEVPIGAVVVCQGRIIARAHNQTETLNDATAHAEMLAITAAAAQLGGKYLPQCTLYVTVEPCPMCAGAMGWAQVSRIVYGAGDEKRGYQRYAPNVLHTKATVTGGVLEEECRQLMQQFFKAKR